MEVTKMVVIGASQTIDNAIWQNDIMGASSFSTMFGS
jgi:hypothetical protein